MRVLVMNEKTYRKLVEKAGCYFCANHREVVLDDLDMTIPDGICADCCCSKIFMEHFKWNDNIKVVDLRN